MAPYLWMLCAGASAVLFHGCNTRRAVPEGVIVRQVLHGTDVLQESSVQTPSEAAPKALQPGQVTTTLVADTPQAFYKQAAEATRRMLESDGPRQALNQLESHIEQEQENEP